MNQLTKVETSIYIPSFDENNDIYIDKSPYKPYERKCIKYECRCKAGAILLEIQCLNNILNLKSKRFDIELQKIF